MKPGRTIAEWLTIARVSKGTGHVFVEGPSDARILTHLSGYPSKVDIRTGADIDCHTSDGTPLCGGFKLRLLKLAVAAANKNSIDNVKCLGDRDFGTLASLTSCPSHFHQTDFANLPSTTFTQEWLKAFLLKGFGYLLTDAKWLAIQDCLRDSFFARYISATSDEPAKAPEVSTYISIKSEMIFFDRQKYVSDFFTRGDKRKAQDFLSDIDDFKAWMSIDVRYTANSNDIFDLLFIILKKSGKLSGSAAKETIRQAFMSAFSDDVSFSQEVSQVIEWIRYQEGV